jgi:hypothetical protein
MSERPGPVGDQAKQVTVDGNQMTVIRRWRWAPWGVALAVVLVVLGARLRIFSHHPNGTSGRVAAAKVAVASAAFPLRVSDDGRYLVDHAGRPFLLQGEAAWSLVAGLKNDDADAYLEDRRRRGFNAIIVNLVEHKFSHHPPDDAYGDPPFTKAGDFSTPNEAYFAHADSVLRLAEQKGIAVLLVPSYLGQKGGDEGWYQELLQNGAEVMRGYGAYVGLRYHGFSNIVWVLGGDYTPPAPGLAIVEALAAGILTTDGREHLFTAHWDAETSAQDLRIVAPLDLNTTYTYAPVYEKSLADALRPNALPHILAEATYEHEHDSTPLLVRTQAYYALLTGAVGQVFGSFEIWGFFPGWQEMLGSDGTLDMMNVEALFAPRAWPALVPDVRNEVLTGGLGSRGTNDYAVLSSARDRSLAIAYIPSARTVTIDLGRLKTPIRARWYDPTHGDFKDASGSPFQDTGPVALATPGSNGAGDPDWALVLETVP